MENTTNRGKSLLLTTLISVSGFDLSSQMLSQNINPGFDWPANEMHIVQLIENEFKNFNGSILIGLRGKEKVFQPNGWTDITRVKKIHKNSRFNVGSLAKEILAITILHLIRDKVISYDDKIETFIGDLPEWSKRVTIKDLLFYRSGLPDIDFEKSKNDKLAIEKLSEISELKFEPGADYSYSNYNNFILAKIVEQVTRQDFQTYITEKYLKKIGMLDSFYGSTVPEEHKNITRSFSDIYGDDVEGNPNFKVFRLCYAPLYMTITDVSKWIEFVRENYLISDQYTKDFFQPTSAQSQGPLGIIQWLDGKVHNHRHGGFAYSFGTSTYLDYSTGLTIIVMTNANQEVSIQNLSNEILEITQKNIIR